MVTSIVVNGIGIGQCGDNFLALLGQVADREAVHYFVPVHQIGFRVVNIEICARRNIRGEIAHALRNIQRVDFPIRIRIHMLPVQTCAAVQLWNLIAVHIHQLCHRETSQQSLEAIVRAGGSLAVLILQGGDLIQIRLSTLRRQGTEVSRAGGADCHCAGQYGAEHCLPDFVHRDSPSFYQTLASFLYCTAGVSLRQPENMGRFLSPVKYFTI